VADAQGRQEASLPHCRCREPTVQTLGQRHIHARRPKARASLIQELLAVMAIVALAPSLPAKAAPNRCSELKPMAAHVRSENELVQEEHLPHIDPRWCKHARAITKAMSVMMEIIKSDENHCQLGNDKCEALQTSSHRVVQLTEGCP
jgi:hypothetical protein